MTVISVVLVIVIAMIFAKYTGTNIDHASNQSLYLLITGILALVIGLLYANFDSKRILQAGVHLSTLNWSSE